MSMMKSGRVLYDWLEDAGGIPPNLSHILTEKEKVWPFFTRLLQKHSGLDLELKDILISNGIQFLKDFISLLKKDPLHNPSLQYLKQNNMFIYEIFKAAEDVGVSEETLFTWSDEITQGFKVDNFDALPQVFNDDHGDVPLVSSNWSFRQFCEQSNQRQRIIHQNNLRIKEKLDGLISNMRAMKQNLNDFVNILHQNWFECQDGGTNNNVDIEN